MHRISKVHCSALLSAWAFISSCSLSTSGQATTTGAATTGVAASGTSASAGNAGSGESSTGGNASGAGTATGASGGSSVSSGSGGVAGANGGGSGSALGSGVASGATGSGTVASGSIAGSGVAGSGLLSDGGLSGPDATTLPESGVPVPPDAGRSSKVLIYTATTGFRHADIPTAANAIAQAAMAAGLIPVISPPNAAAQPVPADFAPGALDSYGAVVLLSTSGQPMGAPGTQQIQTLVDFVVAGGGLVVIHDATHAYDNSFPPASPAYLALVGADFNGHTGYGPGTCITVGQHPSTALLPSSFAVTDEIYFYMQVAADIHVVLNCANTGGMMRPISWVRTQGAGRVFHTGLGHDNTDWTAGPLLSQHVMPGLLWTMGR